MVGGDDGGGEMGESEGVGGEDGEGLKDVGVGEKEKTPRGAGG